MKTMTTQKNTKSRCGLLFALLVASVCATVFNSCHFGGGGGGGDGGGYQPTDTITKPTPETEVKTDDILSDFFNLTEEDLEYLRNHPIEVTPENSPGNPAFIDVSYTEEDLAQTYIYSASVSQETPETDIPELGIHVNFKSWNLDYEEDTLVVMHFPDKFDENTGMILHTYGYFLTSGQNEFCTDVEITAPVPGDPDMFYGFVSYNEETGRWEDVYCELAEDRSTYTAYLSHFSQKSALERIKDEGIAAINLFRQDGKSIFVQETKEMKPKYERSSHYLYPVSVSSGVDFEKFFSYQLKNEIRMAKKLMANGGKIPKKDAFTAAFECFGMNEQSAKWGSTANDVGANAAGTYDMMKNISKTLSQVKNGTTNVGVLGQGLTMVGIIFYALNIADYVVQDTIENPSVMHSLGVAFEGVKEMGCLPAIGVVVGGASLFTAAGSTASIICTVAGAAICAHQTKETIVSHVNAKEYPMGMPFSITEAAIYCYMQHNATSENGYAKNHNTSWFGSFQGPADQIDSTAVYEHHPEKLLDCNWGHWANAYDCIVKKYSDDFTRLNANCDSLYSRFADAFWKESEKVQRQCFREACKKYVKINMTHMWMDSDKKVHSEVTTSLDTELEKVDYFDMDTINSNWTPKERQEWAGLQQEVIQHAKRLKEQEEQEKMRNKGQKNDYRRPLELGDAWDAVFRDWDESNFDIKLINAAKNNPRDRKTYHNRLVKQLKANTGAVAQEYYKKKRREGVVAVKNMLDNVIVPLLNTRLTFYARNRDKPDGPYSSIVNENGTLPLFAFECDRIPHFEPFNSEDVGSGFHLDLKANDKNAVLLETTVYHYLMFGCPVDATITYQRDGEHTTSAKANWTNVKIVQEAKQAEWSIWNIFGQPEVNIEDTKIPVEYGSQTGKKLEFVRNQFDLGVEETSEAVTAALTKGNGSVSDNSFSFRGSYSTPVKKYTDESNYFGEGSYTSTSGNISANVEITGTFDPKTGYGTCSYKATETQTESSESEMGGSFRMKHLTDKHTNWTYQGEGTVTVYDDNTVRCDINGTSKCDGKSDVKSYVLKEGKWVSSSDGNKVEPIYDNKFTHWNLLFKIAD